MVFNIAQFSKSSHGKVQAGQANRSILNWCLSLCKEVVVQIIFAKSIYMFYTWLCSSVLITFTPCTAPFSTCQSQLANLVVYLKIWFLLFIHNDGKDSMSMLGLISSKMHKNPRRFGCRALSGCHPDLDSDLEDLQVVGLFRVSTGWTFSALEESMALWRLDCHDFGTCV